MFFPITLPPNVLKQTSHTTSHTAMVAPTALCHCGWPDHPGTLPTIQPWTSSPPHTTYYVLQVLADYIPPPPSRTTPGAGLRELTKQQGLWQPVVQPPLSHLLSSQLHLLLTSPIVIRSDHYHWFEMPKIICGGMCLACSHAS